MEQKKKVTGYIYTYSKKARDTIIGIAKNFLVTYGVQDISGNLFSCVDEIVKNAVKANYKYILISDEILKKLAESYPDKSPSQLKKEICDIVKVHETFEHLAGDVLKHKNISEEVREILNEESKYLNIKDRAYLEKRTMTEEEQSRLRRFPHINYMKKRIKEQDIKIILKMQSDGDYIYIEVTNTAPILSHDLHRIYQKRDEYKKYKSKGMEYKFFVNNLDTSESGFGLGYATIDSVLYHWGLDPERAITIITSIDTTVMLTIPLSELKK